ncbi:MAG: hypothetical protein QOK07_1818 [Gemmatimonadaceae bacterium]|nr:hypothetical protein [Gemmatimonadaceae bacterium]
MSRRAKIWGWVAGLYVVLNVGGLAIAGVMREEMHAYTHLFLLLLAVAAYGGYRLARRGAPENHLPRAELAESRIEYLQQSVDAMALELERVGEAQRFNDKLRVEKGETLPQKKEQ